MISIGTRGTTSGYHVQQVLTVAPIPDQFKITFDGVTGKIKSVKVV